MGERYVEDLLRTLVALSDVERSLLLESIESRTEAEWAAAAENLALVLPFAEMNIAAAMGTFGFPPTDVSSRTFVFLTWNSILMEDHAALDGLFRPSSLLQRMPSWFGPATDSRGPTIDSEIVSMEAPDEGAGP